MKLIDEDSPVIENFCDYVCSWCANHSLDCAPFCRCDWQDQFEEARELFSKLFYLEEDPDCIYGTSEDDYDFEAQAKAYDAVDERLNELENALIKDVQENQIEYYKYFGYEM